MNRLKIVFQLLNPYGYELTLDDVETGNQSALEEAEEPEPESKERTMTVLKLAEGLVLTEAGSNNWTRI
jgi:hypothetical protein